MATGRLRGGLVGPSRSPARSAPRREAPTSTIRRAPPRPCCAGTAQQGRLSRRSPRRLGPRCPACSTARPRLLPRRCSHCGRGALVVGAGPWTRIAPGVDHTGEEGLPRACAAIRWTAPAHRVGGLRGPSRPRSEAAPIVNAKRWPIHAPSCPGVQADDHRIQAARVGTVPLRYPPRRRASPPGTVGATGLEGPHLRGRRSWPWSRSSCWDAPTEPTRLLPESLMIGQLSGQPAFQGHSSSEAGSRPSVPVITGPARIDPLEQAAQRPTGTQPLHHTRTRQHEPSHHQSPRIDPSKSKGTRRQMNTPTGRSPRWRGRGARPAPST